jgi:hypothetical protein
VDRDQRVGLEEEVAGHHDGPGGHQQAQHRLGPLALEGLVEEGAHRQGQRSQRREPGLAGHQHEDGGEREAEASEDQEVELSEGQPPAVSPRLVGAQADERAPQREHHQRAPGEQAEAELLDEVLEELRRRTAARDRPQQQRVLAGGVGGGQGQHQHDDADERHQRQPPVAVGAPRQQARPEAAIGGHVLAGARRRQHRGGLALGGVRAQPPSGGDGAGNRQTGERHPEQGPARQQPDAEADRAHQQIDERALPALRPEVAPQPGHGQGQPRHQRDVRGELARLEDEERHAPQGQRPQEARPLAEQARPAPVHRQHRHDPEERAEQARPQLAGGEHLHAQRRQQQRERRRRPEAPADGGIAQARPGHLAGPIGHVQLPGVPEPERAQAWQQHGRGEDRGPRRRGNAAQSVSEAHREIAPEPERPRTLSNARWPVHRRRRLTSSP